MFRAAWLPLYSKPAAAGSEEGTADAARYAVKSDGLNATASSSASPRGGLAFAKHAKPDSLTFDKPRRRVIGI
mgnify:CR=1 FL=1